MNGSLVNVGTEESADDCLTRMSEEGYPSVFGVKVPLTLPRADLRATHLGK